MPVWWAVSFGDRQEGKTGFVVLSSDRSQQLGIAVPAWGGAIVDPALAGLLASESVPQTLARQAHN